MKGLNVKDKTLVRKFRPRQIKSRVEILERYWEE